MLMPRLFIGIFVPENLKTKIVLLQKEIEKLPAKLKLVELENLHISLSFLGNVEESRIDELKEKLDSVAQAYTKFETKISGLKLIPNENYVRVIALNLQNGVLNLISKHVEKEIGGDVNPPHLTLCRIKSISDKKFFVEKILNLNSDIGKFTVDSLDLVESKLGQNGPVYNSLHKSFLLNK